MSASEHYSGYVPPWTLGTRLWRARRYLGVTQQELATRLGIGLQQVKDGSFFATH
jgi:DNA-binding transcriptional regulator YiaG